MVSTGSGAKQCRVTYSRVGLPSHVLLWIYILNISNTWIIVVGSLSKILYKYTNDGCKNTEVHLL